MSEVKNEIQNPEIPHKLELFKKKWHKIGIDSYVII